MSAIGGLNETELHEQIKLIYAGETGRTEHLVDGFVVDVMLENEIIEVQTRGMGRLRRKIERLTPSHTLRIVHPVARRTLINKLGADGELLSSRASPKRGRLEHAFREISAIADLLPDRAVTVEVLLVDVIETRIADGTGSWRRKGVRIAARRLAQVVETHSFTSAKEYRALIPQELLDVPFTNTDLQERLGVAYAMVQPLTSSLRKMGLLEISGKRGRELVYAAVL